MKAWVVGGAAAFGLVVVGLAAVDAAFGHMAVMALYRHGGALFLPISTTSERLSPSMRLALGGSIPAVTAGPFAWHGVGEGIEQGELPVMAGDRQVDSILLARVDPSRNAVVVRNDSHGDREVGDWMKALDARLVINGSYYAPSGKPDTPFLEAGRQIGPTEYKATQGALTVSGADDAVAIRDLSETSWEAAFAGAHDALVSYPLLIENGRARPIKPSDWLANRTFIGTDRHGRVIFGTTTDAFFSLARLAQFLQASPLDLASVLNLDGGPIACQAMHVGTFRRDFCGEWELNFASGRPKKLSWFFGRWALPIVVAVVPKH